LQCSSASRSGLEKKRMPPGVARGRDRLAGDQVGVGAESDHVTVRFNDRQTATRCSTSKRADSRTGAFLLGRHDVLRHHIGRTYARVLSEHRSARVAPWLLVGPPERLGPPPARSPRHLFYSRLEVRTSDGEALCERVVVDPPAGEKLVDTPHYGSLAHGSNPCAGEALEQHGELGQRDVLNKRNPGRGHLKHPQA